MLPVLVHVELNPVEIRDVFFDEDVAWVATSSGADVYDSDGALLARVDNLPCSDVRVVGSYKDRLTLGTECGAFVWNDGWKLLGRQAPVAAIVDAAVFYRSGHIYPFGNVGTPIVDAVDWRDGWAIATADGRILLDEAIVRMSAPVADLAVVDGELRVAIHTAAVTIAADGTITEGAIRATSAGPGWGTVDGALLDDEGQRLGAVPGTVVAMAAGPEGAMVATVDGLWMVTDHDTAAR